MAEQESLDLDDPRINWLPGYMRQRFQEAPYTGLERPGMFPVPKLRMPRPSPAGVNRGAFRPMLPKASARGLIPDPGWLQEEA